MSYAQILMLALKIVGIAAVLLFVALVAGTYFGARAAKATAEQALAVAQAADVKSDAAKEAARIGTWHLAVAATGPHAGMPVSWRPPEGDDERPGMLLRASTQGQWMLAVFDEASRTWTIEGPALEGTREERGTFTPSIAGAMRPGLGTHGH